MTPSAELTASDGAAGDQFGSSVAISGNTLVVGSPYATVCSNYQPGAAYVFTESASGWTQSAKLTASDGAAYDGFGSSVAISGNTLVVGASVATVGGVSDRGAAYVFAEPGSGWASMTESAKLTASDGAAGDQFGSSVAISGNTLVVGSPLARVCNSEQGAAYLFLSSSLNVSDATTTENTQTTSGLVITPSAGDADVVNNFQITNIIGGSLFLNDGTTPVTDGQFITVAQGAAGLKFTPTTGSQANGAFTIQESTTAGATGLIGAAATATITLLMPAGPPLVTDAETTENTQTAAGLVITPAPADTGLVKSFQITTISGGSLFLSDGVTPVTDGEFISVAQGAAGLKFTPAAGSPVNGSFSVQESATTGVSGLSGAPAAATITGPLGPPVATDAETTENTQTAAGLVITPAPADTGLVKSFQITAINGGSLFLSNGVTPVADGEFISVAQGAAGLKFTPTARSPVNGSFSIQESATTGASGLSGARPRPRLRGRWDPRS